MKFRTLCNGVMVVNTLLLLALISAPAFAQVKISELPSAGAVIPATEVPAVQAGTTVKVTPNMAWTFGHASTNAAPSIRIQSARPQLELFDTDCAANECRWRMSTQAPFQIRFEACNDGGDVCQAYIRAQQDASDIILLELFGDNMTFDGAVKVGEPAGSWQGIGSLNAEALYINGSPVTAVTTGTATVTWETACTSNPTQDFRWTKIGSVVTLTALEDVSCTSDSAGFSSVAGALPVEIRPPSGVDIRIHGALVTNNGTQDAASGCLTVTGNGTLAVLRSVTGPCADSAWTTSGTKTWTVVNGPRTYVYDTATTP